MGLVASNDVNTLADPCKIAGVLLPITYLNGHLLAMILRYVSIFQNRTNKIIQSRLWSLSSVPAEFSGADGMPCRSLRRRHYAACFEWGFAAARRVGSGITQPRTS